MQVILRADVENLGRLGDVVTVRPGYGRNYLLPQGMAMPATKANLKVFELERKKLQAEMDALRAAAGELGGRIKNADITITMRVGENNKLYGSVTSAVIADALAAKGIEIDRRRVIIDAPIRTVGEFPVRVRLHADVLAELTIKVQPEEHPVYDDEPAQPAAPAAVDAPAAGDVQSEQ
ncbi:50S ribosomal subunit protein L9 [uncultured delta proteobacterium]|uniref:Large ribosomal subunit protein bL9 n=1 Tax=uncultured delta proteobacterium TaxID=34034 RepID=A0A212KEB9_9DELT|nr:50S ribosomal subunit protein L9 [uncultured delta proteobacterium]